MITGMTKTKKIINAIPGFKAHVSLISFNTHERKQIDV